MLYSQGVPLEALGIGNPDADPREAWRLFATRYHLFRGTPSQTWLDWVFAEAFGKLNGEMVHLWQAVDHEGEILESHITKTRDKAAALTFH